jgi:hypothetical protein
MRYRPIRKNYPAGQYGDIDYYERLERYCTYLENKIKAEVEKKVGLNEDLAKALKEREMEMERMFGENYKRLKS